MALPEIVDEEEWLTARKALLEKEKAAARARDALSAERRRLPMVEVTKEYRFTGADGDVSLRDLFDGRRQLIVVHFMFGPNWDEGCPVCTQAQDQRSARLYQDLANRDTTMVTVARAPWPKLDAYRRKRGWNAPFFSSYGSDFNYDYQVSYRFGDRRVFHNYREMDGPANEQATEAVGLSCFLRDGERIFHTYSTYQRGAELSSLVFYNYLDLTALGRQEAWETQRYPDPRGA